MRTLALGEICEFKYGSSLPERSRESGNVPVYGSNGQVGFHSEALTDGPAIIVGRKGSIGQINYSPHPCWPIDTTYFVDQSATKHDLRWLSYALASLKLDELNKATGVPGLNRNDAYVKNLCVPPLDEQRRIASILDQADDLRHKRREALLKLNVLPDSVLVEACGEPANNPMKWPMRRLGDVCSSVSDGPHVSPEYVENGVPFLSTRNIRPDGIVWSDLKFISEADAQMQWKKVKPARGDVLYTKGGTTGIARAVDFDLDFAVWVHVAVLKLLKNKAEPVWLQEMLNSSYCYRQSQRLTKGIVNRDLGLRRMVDIEFPLPPLDLQRAFAARVAEIDKLKSHHRAHLARLDALFASLQHRAFRGEL